MRHLRCELTPAKVAELRGLLEQLRSSRFSYITTLNKLEGTTKRLRAAGLLTPP